MSEGSFFQKKLWRWLPGILISVAAVVFLLFFVDWQQFAVALQSISITTILLLFLLSLLSLIFRSLSWKALLNEESTFSDSFFIESIGYLLNNLLPLRLGELGRAVLMGSKTGRGFFYTLSSIVVERLMDVAFAAISLLIALPFLTKVNWSSSTPVITLVVVLVGVVVVWLIAKKQSIIAEWINTMGEKHTWFGKKLAPAFVSVLKGMEVFASLKVMLKSIGFMAITWLTYWITFFLVIKDIYPLAPFWWAIFTNGILAMGIAIPSAPGGLGVWEASFVGALSILGGTQSLSIAGALVIHLVNYVFIGVLGSLGLIRMGTSFADLVRNITRQKQTSE